MNDAFGLPQSVVVLGGTSDIAVAVMEELGAAACHRAVLAARDAERLEGAAERCRRAGATTVDTVDLEATDLGGAASTVERCFEKAGDVDLVLVAVGLLGDQHADEREPARVTEVVGVNFTWPAAAMARAAALLERQGHGRLMVLSSVAGVRVRRANYVYGSAKAGLDGYAVGLAEALRGTGVTVQIVRPGFVRTKMTEGMPPAPLATTPEAVAAAVRRGLTTGEAVIWVPPALRFVFAVFRLLPQAIWRRLPG